MTYIYIYVLLDEKGIFGFIIISLTTICQQYQYLTISFLSCLFFLYSNLFREIKYKKLTKHIVLFSNFTIFSLISFKI